MTAPPDALTWETAAQRNRQLKLWRSALFATFGEQSRCIRLAWALADLFNIKMGYAFPSNSQLARETHIPENKLRATLGVLEAGGAIMRGWVTYNGQKQRVIYPSAALLPRPTLGPGGSPSSRGTII